MPNGKKVLVLGACGLAGRSIVLELLRSTDYEVIASGRDIEKMVEHVFAAVVDPRLDFVVLDVTNIDSLRKDCGQADLVINAVGPYGRLGAQTARAVIESGRSYIDCASEQGHYAGLQLLDAAARDRGCLMVTAAGFIPGISGLLAAYLLDQTPGAHGVDCCLAQLRHAYADSGNASMMTGILEGSEKPLARRDGRPTPVVIGESLREVDFPAPFGRLRMIEAPTIEDQVLADRYQLRDFHTWYYLGDAPVWMLGMIRVLRPNKWNWSYRLIERLMKNINSRDTAKAIARGLGPEAILLVTVKGDGVERQASIVFRDGAVATAILPVMIAREYLEGRLSRRGLGVPLDVLDPKTVLRNLGPAVIESNIP